MAIIEDETEFMRMWDDPSMTARDIATWYGCGISTVRNKAYFLRLGDKPLDTPEILPGDPTPEEIEQRCAEVRSKWPQWRLKGVGSHRMPDKNGDILTVEIRRFDTDRIHGGFVCR